MVGNRLLAWVPPVQRHVHRLPASRFLPRRWHYGFSPVSVTFGNPSPCAGTLFSPHHRQGSSDATRHSLQQGHRTKTRDGGRDTGDNYRARFFEICARDFLFFMLSLSVNEYTSKLVNELTSVLVNECTRLLVHSLLFTFALSLINSRRSRSSQSPPLSCLSPQLAQIPRLCQVGGSKS